MSQSRSKKPKKPDPDKLLAKLVALKQPEADVPPGFRDIEYWSQRFNGKDRSDVYELLKAGVKAGVIESGSFRPERGARRKTHWREIK
jgi:hypothetical protein